VAVFVALLRGINVGGNNKLPMAELRSCLGKLGYADVRTYIQSGNVAFRGRGTTRSVEKRIEAALRERFELSSSFTVLGLTATELQAALAANPYEDAARADPRRVHLHFLGGAPNAAALQAMAKLASGGDRFELLGKVLYLHTPDGYGKSKLAEALVNAKKLGVSCTARNYRTVQALMALATEVAG
jgi:uncharacterized protein (DUF1697 family)